MGDAMSLRLLRHAALVVVPFLFTTASASAHHVMGGKTPTTFVDGFLSGLGHPVIGPDHLAFLLAIFCAGGSETTSSPGCNVAGDCGTPFGWRCPGGNPGRLAPGGATATPWPGCGGATAIPAPSATSTRPGNIETQ